MGLQGLTSTMGRAHHWMSTGTPHTIPLRAYGIVHGGLHGLIGGGVGQLMGLYILAW